MNGKGPGRPPSGTNSLGTGGRYSSPVAGQQVRRRVGEDRATERMQQSGKQQQQQRRGHLEA